MLEALKKLLGINNDQFDSIIEGLVKSAKEDLKSVSIANVLVDSIDGSTPNELIKTAVMTYVMAHFDNSSELLSSYDMQKDNLRNKAQFQEVV